MIAQLGNTNPTHVSVGEETDEHWTTVEFPEGMTVDEAMLDLTDPSGVWVNQSADAAPAWVAASPPELEAAIAAHYDIPTRLVAGINS